MKTLGLIAVYAVSFFLTDWLLLDMERVLGSEQTVNRELEISKNVLLGTLEDMRYWSRFIVFPTFLILALKCFLMALVLYAGLFFTILHQGLGLGQSFRVTFFAELALVLAGMVKVRVGAISEFIYSEFAIFSPLSLLYVLEVDGVPSQAANNLTLIPNF